MANKPLTFQPENWLLSELEAYAKNLGLKSPEDAIHAYIKDLKNQLAAKAGIPHPDPLPKPPQERKGALPDPLPKPPQQTKGALPDPIPRPPQERKGALPEPIPKPPQKTKSVLPEPIPKPPQKTKRILQDRVRKRNNSVDR